MRKAPRWTRFGLATALAIGIGLAPLAAQADDYDQRRSGHPLRVVGYVLHPVGMLIDTLIFRPAHWVGSHEPFSTIFGHETD